MEPRRPDRRPSIDTRPAQAYIATASISLPISPDMRKVLVVDDSATMRRMVIAALRELKDVVFHQAQSGLEAIERLSVEPVDLVVLDLNMPDVHGIEVLRFVRGHHAFESTPVIVLTTRGDAESRDAALREGASAYVTKPFEPATLAPEVRRLLDPSDG
jgi:two-component system chemotaxis response regulator CheY